MTFFSFLFNSDKLGFSWYNKDIQRKEVEDV